MDTSQAPSHGKNPRPPKVKNKNPAPIQITAEQILREAHDRRLEPKITEFIPKQKIADLEELSEYRQRKRKEFEDLVRRSRSNIGSWLRYATWEESQKELNRARSVFERALDVEPRNPSTWLRYTEMEMKNRNVNLARNLFDRAVTLLPRVDQFWYKFTYMEETLGDIPKARQIFERWMQWQPDEQAWMAYIKMERRYNETERARAIFHRFVETHPEPKNWIKWAKFEEDLGDYERVREIYSNAMEYLGEDHMDQRLYASFAKFEVKMKEFERARVIFKYALDRLPKSKSEALYKQYTQFEKQYGDKEGIEDVVVGKRRMQYEEEIKSNPKNYDIWFDLARLEEGTGDLESAREVYERAIAQVPPIEEKRYWRRYIYLWINYALFEELSAKDYERTRQIYTLCLNLIPHTKFTFAKIWLLCAQFEVRRMELSTARKILGRAIGMCPKDKLFKGYIELELQLREFDRCRTLYGKYLEWNSANCAAWIKFAEMERLLGELERARGIFELAVSQRELDMPELLWKAYIDFEFAEEEFSRTRDLYKRLLERTEHVKVWISFAHFELEAPPAESAAARAREIFKRAYQSMKEKELKEERMVLLESWKELETQHGQPETLEDVKAKMPKVVKKRRQIESDTGDMSWEEYFTYVFPDDEDQKPNFKLLAMAQAWKQKMAQMQQSKSEHSDEGNDNNDDDDDDDDNDDVKTEEEVENDG